MCCSLAYSFTAWNPGSLAHEASLTLLCLPFLLAQLISERETASARERALQSEMLQTQSRTNELHSALGNEQRRCNEVQVELNTAISKCRGLEAQVWHQGVGAAA